MSTRDTQSLGARLSGSHSRSPVDEEKILPSTTDGNHQSTMNNRGVDLSVCSRISSSTGCGRKTVVMPIAPQACEVLVAAAQRRCFEEENGRPWHRQDLPGRSNPANIYIYIFVLLIYI